MNLHGNSHVPPKAIPPLMLVPERKGTLNGRPVTFLRIERDVHFRTEKPINFNFPDKPLGKTPLAKHRQYSVL